jgi:hypothetical protein
VNPLELADEMRRLSRLLDKGIDALRDQAQEVAQAEHDYRAAKSEAWVSAPDGTVPERQAWVDGRCAKLRYRRDLAEGLRQAALEAVRSRRTQVSALQTLCNASLEELKFSRTGPEMAA